MFSIRDCFVRFRRKAAQKLLLAMTVELRDQKEGMRAFNEKRKPEWKGK